MKFKISEWPDENEGLTFVKEFTVFHKNRKTQQPNFNYSDVYETYYLRAGYLQCIFICNYK